MSPEQVAMFLVSALIAVESLLMSAFGSLYSVYARYMTQQGGPICGVLRGISYSLTAVIIVAAVVSLYALKTLWESTAGILPQWVIVAMASIVIFPPMASILLSVQMRKDAN